MLRMPADFDKKRWRAYYFLQCGAFFDDAQHLFQGGAVFYAAGALDAQGACGIAQLHAFSQGLTVQVAVETMGTVFSSGRLSCSTEA